MGRFLWKGQKPVSDVRISGDYIIRQAADVEVYTSVAALQRRFAPKVMMNPPHAKACRRLATILRTAGSWPEAAEVYRRFILAAEGDPKWNSAVEEAKWWMKSVGFPP